MTEAKTKGAGKHPDAFRNRIVGEGVEAPDQLLANPRNWRVHPKHQVDALEGLLSSVGWVQRVIVNREWKRLGSFPDDYVAQTDKVGKYMIGMSVPPKMAEQVARAVCAQWLGIKPLD